MTLVAGAGAQGGSDCAARVHAIQAQAAQVTGRLRPTPPVVCVCGDSAILTTGGVPACVQCVSEARQERKRCVCEQSRGRQREASMAAMPALAVVWPIASAVLLLAAASVAYVLNLSEQKWVWDCIHGLAGDFQSPTALKDGPKVRQRRVRHRRRGRAADCDKTVPGIAKLPKTLAGLGRARFAARALLVAAVIWLAILVASPCTVGSCLCSCFQTRAVVMLGVCRDASESFVRVPPRRSRPATTKPTHRRT